MGNAEYMGRRKEGSRSRESQEKDQDCLLATCTTCTATTVFAVFAVFSVFAVLPAAAAVRVCATAILPATDVLPALIVDAKERCTLTSLPEHLFLITLAS